MIETIEDKNRLIEITKRLEERLKDLPKDKKLFKSAVKTAIKQNKKALLKLNKRAFKELEVLLSISKRDSAINILADPIVGFSREGISNQIKNQKQHIKGLEKEIKNV